MPWRFFWPAEHFVSCGITTSSLAGSAIFRLGSLRREAAVISRRAAHWTGQPARVSQHGGLRLRVEVPAVAGMIVELLRLDHLAIETTTVAMLGLVAVAEHHVLFKHTFRQFRHGTRARVLALTAGSYVTFARICHGFSTMTVSAVLA